MSLPSPLQSAQFMASPAHPASWQDLLLSQCPWGHIGYSETKNFLFGSLFWCSLPQGSPCDYFTSPAAPRSCSGSIGGVSPMPGGTPALHESGTLLAQGTQSVFYLMNDLPYAEEWGRKS